jgi:hypothetical protein
MQPMTLLQARYLADERLPSLNQSGKPIPGEVPQILACLRDTPYVFAYRRPRFEEPRAPTALLLLSNAEEPQRPDGLVQLNSNQEVWPEHDNDSWWGNCTWLGSYHAGICTPCSSSRHTNYTSTVGLSASGSSPSIHNSSLPWAARAVA